MSQLWFQTFTGTAFSFEDIDPGAINIDDVAHHLSLLCRYNGATRGHYSVAQHSVLVADILQAQGYGIEVQWAGLLHDAHEAYTGDIIQPVKKWLLARSPAIRELEEALDAAIQEKFHFLLDDPTKVIVKQADLIALATEARDLLGAPPKPWEDLVDINPFQTRVVGKPPLVAKNNFLTRFYGLEVCR